MNKYQRYVCYCHFLAIVLSILAFTRILEDVSQTLTSLNAKGWKAGANRWVNRNELKDNMGQHSRRLDNFRDVFAVSLIVSVR